MKEDLMTKAYLIWTKLRLRLREEVKLLLMIINQRMNHNQLKLREEGKLEVEELHGIRRKKMKLMRLLK
jgi:hypothetical protein